MTVLTRPTTSTQQGISCPSTYTCSLADVAFVGWDSTREKNDFDQGWKVYETTDSTNHYTGGAAGTTIASSPTLTLSNETTMGSFHVGDPTHKVGIGSGHTYGPISGTCVNIVYNTGLMLTCQMTADLYSGPGDSGGTIYSPWGGDPTKATLLGVLTGTIHYSPGDSTRTFFASIDAAHYSIQSNGAPFAACNGCTLW